MDGRKSFPHDIFMRAHPKSKLLQALLDNTPRMETYGRLCALLEVMYTMGNKIPVNTGSERLMMCEELCFGSWDDAEAFLDACAEAGWIDAEPYSRGTISSHNVQEQLDYYESKVESAKKAGEKSGAARRKKKYEHAANTA